MLGILETMTGLSGPSIPSALRAAELVPDVRSISGFWSRSAQVDPFGTAKRVLQWRDLLRMHGWRSQPVSTRLEELAEVTVKASPGFPDRLLMVADTLIGSIKANLYSDFWNATMLCRLQQVKKREDLNVLQ